MLISRPCNESLQRKKLTITGKRAAMTGDVRYRFVIEAVFQIRQLTTLKFFNRHPNEKRTLIHIANIVKHKKVTNIPIRKSTFTIKQESQESTQQHNLTTPNRESTHSLSEVKNDTRRHRTRKKLIHTTPGGDRMEKRPQSERSNKVPRNDAHMCGNAKYH